MTNPSSPFFGHRYPGQAAEPAPAGGEASGALRARAGSAGRLRPTGSAHQPTRLRGNGGTEVSQGITTLGVAGGYEFSSLREEEMGGESPVSKR